MRKNLLFYCFLLIPFTFSITSCSEDAPPDPCESVFCDNGGSCLEGVCHCADWYEGSDCSQEVRANFYGTYFGTASTGSQSAVTEFSLLQRGTNPSFMSLSGLVDVVLESDIQFKIPLQQILIDEELILMEGTGSLDGNILALLYRLTTPENDVIIYSFTGTK